MTLQQADEAHDHIIATEKKSRAVAESALNAQALQHQQALDSRNAVTNDLTDKVSKLEEEKVRAP